MIRPLLVSSVVVSVVGGASCTSKEDAGVRHVLYMSQLAPTTESAEERLMLSIWYDGQYELIHAPDKPKSGALSEAELAELTAHTSAAAAEDLIDAAVDFDRCAESAAAYAVDIGNETTGSRTGPLCLVPADITGDAKEHLDAYVSVFTTIADK